MSIFRHLELRLMTNNYCLLERFKDIHILRNNTKAIGESYMTDYEYNTTRLITDFFDEKSIPYRVHKTHELEEVISGFNVESGPSLAMHYINTDNENDLTVLMLLINDVPSNKRNQILEACNRMNRQCHHVCFFVTDNNDVMFSYDFLQSMPDECIGDAALELLLRTKAALDDNYAELMRVLYMPDSEPNIKIDDAFRKLLSDISSSKDRKNNNSKHSDQDMDVE